MKKIISIILILTLLASISIIFTSCDNKNDQNNGGGSFVPPQDNTETEEPEDETKDPVPVANQMLGLVTDLNEYNPDDAEKVYVRVDVSEFTDKVVYLISRVAIPGLSAKFRNVSAHTETEIELSEWSYDEARGIYYATFKAPNVAGNATYQVLTVIDGVDSGRIFAVQIVKKMNVDPNGWV